MEQAYYQPRPPRKFTLSTAWAIVGLLIAATMIVGFPAAIIGLVADKLPIDAEQVKGWTMAISNLVSFVLLFFIVAKLYGNTHNLKPLMELKRISPISYPILLVLSLSLAIALEPLSNLLLELVPMPEMFEKLFANVFKPNASTFLMAVILAPVCEEVLMRGIILRGLLSSCSPLKAILWSAFLFAFIHLNPWQGLPAFIIGVVLGWVYWKTRSILPCIFIHFVNNLFAFIGIYLAEKKGLPVTTSFQEMAGEQFMPIYLASLAGLAISGTLLYLKYQRKKVEKL